MVENRQEFQHDLETIEGKVIELFAMVAEDLPGATQALLTGNTEVIQVLTERERAIDALYLEIENLVNREILLQSPVAADLRFLLSVLRIVPELERTHDLVMQIVSRANHVLGGDLSPRCQGLVARMGITLVAHFYERLGDHAVNIARRVIYLAGTHNLG
jgi:phosphate transport system protein